MKRLSILGLFVVLTISLTSFVNKVNSGGGDYKCLIQLKNYQGEGAYVVISLIDNEGEYVKTLRVLGDDREWYPDLPAWNTFREKNRFQPRLDGITGASIGSGERSVVSFTLEEQYIDKGYTLRFETSVEDKKYHKEDVVIDLSKDNLSKGKYEGEKGYIRMIRLIPV
ncbi:DUF2271 domain-containing protein [Brumimicrobium aurantiacum]|uniref:DUF2271 domain-containing protein n=1 Tax=Brumimicrobium aurantiacum TaxID=1737063 RepID=A0A3E1F1R4_9FLAO|nr:DUF2271 domain-containing protein [Brumimicrobium aurantiacum]RFC55750.1 DUF2271 domain-containing protein [Brumimicrobium aurantiacum]